MGSRRVPLPTPHSARAWIRPLSALNPPAVFEQFEHCLSYTCIHCDQLILRKNSKTGATRCHILRLKCTKFDSVGVHPLQTPLGSLQGKGQPERRGRKARGENGRVREGRGGLRPSIVDYGFGSRASQAALLALHPFDPSAVEEGSEGRRARRGASSLQALLFFHFQPRSQLR